MLHMCIPTGESPVLRLAIRLFRTLSHANCRVISNPPWSGETPQANHMPENQQNGSTARITRVFNRNQHD
jgi:hypothetical protein